MQDASALQLSNGHGLTVSVEPAAGRYTLSCGGEPWLGGTGSVEAFGSPARIVQSRRLSGGDALGHFDGVEWDCLPALRPGPSFKARLKMYAEHHAVFEQEFLEDFAPAPGETPDADWPSVAFPHFTGGGWKDDLHLFTCEKNRTFNYPVLRRGRATGTGQPGNNLFLALTDAGRNAMIVSPASWYLVGTVSLSEEGPRLACGLSGAVPHIPAGTVHRTIVTAARGMNRAFEAWGAALRKLAGVPSRRADEDAALTFLNYWTDAGAAYWYGVMPGKTYEQTLREVFLHHRSIGLPVGVYQLDSWWYHRDGEYDGSITRWQPKARVLCKNYNVEGEARETGYEAELLPEGGLAGLQRAAGRPFVAHFKHVSCKSPYVRGNPNSEPPVAQFDFVREFYAVPRDRDESRRFFGHVMNQAEWGLAGFEHDWLSRIVERCPHMRTLRGGRDYLLGLSDAALAADPGNNIAPHRTLILCMATPAITLQSVEMPAATVLRTSHDTGRAGFEGATRWWWNTYSARLVTALGRFPFFDNRRTKLRGTGPGMANAELELIWVGLTGGILALGDAVGEEDLPLIRRCIDEGGRVLKPEAPAAPLDRCYTFDPHAADAREALIIAAHDSPSSGRVHYVLAMNCNPAGGAVEAAFSLGDLDAAGLHAACDYHSGSVEVLRDGAAIRRTLPPGGFAYWILAPVGPDGLAVLGDLGKHVSASRQVLEGIDLDRLRAVDSFAAAPGPGLAIYSLSHGLRFVAPGLFQRAVRPALPAG